MANEKDETDSTGDSDIAEANRLITEALQKISEHVDSVQIFASKRLDNGSGDETWRRHCGRGNYLARYGQVREWINYEEAEHGRQVEEE